MIDPNEELDLATNNEKRLIAVANLRLLLVAPVARIEVVLTKLAVALDAPLAAATIIDENSQHFIATNTGPLGSEPRNTSHCQYVISRGQFLCITDVTSEPVWNRLKRHLIGDKLLTSYIGFPLRYQSQIIGTVCVVDNRPRKWTSEDQFEVYRASRYVGNLLKEASDEQRGAT